MYFEVISAQYKKDYLIFLTFKDGKKGEVDLSGYTGKNDVFKPFANLAYFRNFKVEYGTLVWGNGEVDIAPEALYERLC
jgi:hypothetical protein